MTELLAVLAGLGTSTVEFLPNLIFAIILLVIGLVIGKIVGRVVYEVLEKVKLDYFISEKKKPMFKFSHLFAVIGKWWVYLAFITAALSENVLGVPALSRWVSDINSFIPAIIGAAVILIVGYILAEYIRGHLRATGELYANIVGKILFFFVMYVAIAMALPILGIPTFLINNILLIIIASVGVGLAIALGWGLKDTVNLLAKKYVKKMKY